MECMELKICMSDKHHRYYKLIKFRQNPRGDPKFLVDVTWNDPYDFWVQPGYSGHMNMLTRVECGFNLV